MYQGLVEDREDLPNVQSRDCRGITLGIVSSIRSRNNVATLDVNEKEEILSREQSLKSKYIYTYHHSTVLSIFHPSQNTAIAAPCPSQYPHTHISLLKHSKCLSIIQHTHPQKPDAPRRPLHLPTPHPVKLENRQKMYESVSCCTR